MGPSRTFRVALIKPSHYDDDGYVIQWRRSYIPSNSLASVYALVAECARERVLEPLLPRVVWQSRTWSAITLRQSLGTTATERPTRQPLA